MEGLIFVIGMIGMLIVMGIVCIILDDMQYRQDDYFDELERKVKRK